MVSRIYKRNKNGVAEKELIGKPSSKASRALQIMRDFWVLPLRVREWAKREDEEDDDKLDRLNPLQEVGK